MNETIVPTQAPSQVPSFTLYVRDLSHFKKEFDSLAKKLAKAGLPTPSYKETGRTQEVCFLEFVTGIGETSRWFPVSRVNELLRDRSRKPTNRVRDVVEMEVTVPQSRLDGYRFVAKASARDGVVDLLPGWELPLPEDTQERIGQCDHCHKNRARSETFLVYHEPTKTYKMVGRQCLAVFLGIDAIGALAAYQGIVTLCRSNEDHEPTSRGYYAVQAAVAVQLTLDTIERQGRYVSKKRAEEEGGVATAYLVAEMVQKGQEFGVEPTPEALDMVQWAIDASVGAPIGTYMANIGHLMRSVYVDTDRLGYVCSIPQAYQKAKADKAAQEAPEGPKSYIADPKVRLKGVEAVVTFCTSFETAWGETYLYSMQPAQGSFHPLVYKGKHQDLEVGQKVLVTGTIKENTEYNGKPQTIIQRPTFTHME